MKFIYDAHQMKIITRLFNNKKNNWQRKSLITMIRVQKLTRKIFTMHSQKSLFYQKRIL